MAPSEPGYKNYDNDNQQSDVGPPGVVDFTFLLSGRWQCGHSFSLQIFGRPTILSTITRTRYSNKRNKANNRPRANNIRPSTNDNVFAKLSMLWPPCPTAAGNYKTIAGTTEDQDASCLVDASLVP